MPGVVDGGGRRRRAALRSPPRATLGDAAVEPAWHQRLTVTVGPSGADIVGTGEKAMQAAVDYVTRLGGGTVSILPGTYRLRNAVYLQSKVRLAGSGPQTVLSKSRRPTTTLAADSDWFDQEITLADARGFEIGDGICLRTKSPDGGSAYVVKRTLVARSGNRFKLDQGLRKNFWRIGNTTVLDALSLLSGENIADVPSRTWCWTAIARRTPTSTAITPAASSCRSAIASSFAASRPAITTATASSGKSATT